jgi:hypothetical protein
MSHANLIFTRLLVNIFFFKRCLDKYKVLIIQEKIEDTKAVNQRMADNKMVKSKRTKEQTTIYKTQD